MPKQVMRRSVREVFMKTKFIATGIATFAVAFIVSLSLTGGAVRTASLSLLIGDRAALAQEAGMSKVIFKVKCYDEGKAALQGLNGIQKIETGFHYVHETDTVYYDPKVITIEEMEKALKKAGTYVETMKMKERN
jgi:copper chaperone CopZ